MTEPSLTTFAAIDSPTASPEPLKKPHYGYLWSLLALTALSGFLCFHRLSVPSLLIDECFTYWRVCGNLDQLLDTLRNDGFMPLHYELLNWIGQGFPLGWGTHLIPGGILLTPLVLRSVSAISGTLMTPVMYFLARQLFDRRTALVAATLIACSAYSLFFSRNAKMYAPAWMFETLAVACFLWWLRTWRRDAWLCWIFAGIAAGGFHAITLLLLPLMPLYFISVGRFSGSKVPLLIIGLLVILLAPAVYYGVFNRWTQNSGGLVPGVGAEPAPDAKWEASGLNWIPSIEDSPRVPFEALNNFLSGYVWDDYTDLSQPPTMLRKFAPAMLAVATATYAFLIFGALPWPHHRRVHSQDENSQPRWRAFLWLSLWMVLPVYGFFYCRSLRDFSTPVDWLEWLSKLIGFMGLIGLSCSVLLAASFNFLPRLTKFIAVPLLLLAVIAVVETARNQWSWLTLISTSAGRIALCTLLPALLFHFSGETFRRRTHQLLRFMAVFITLLLLCEAAALAWRELHQISMRKHPNLPWQSLWNIRYVAIVMPAVWLSVAALISRLPTQFLRVVVVLMICSYNLANGLARQYIQTEVPLDRAMADMYQSQPQSHVRTYFDLRRLTDNVYYRPLASYNACIAAGLHPAPTDFRTGYTWPFQWGSVVSEFQRHCIYNPSISAKKIHHDIANNPQVDKVIVWDLGTLSSAPSDAAARGLGDSWVLASDELIKDHSYWEWEEGWPFRRREYHRRV